MLLGVALCLFLTCDKIVDMAFEIHYIIITPEYGVHGRVARYEGNKAVHHGLNVYSFILGISPKIIFSILVVRLAWLTRSSLRESAQFSGRTKTFHRGIFYFSLIPLFLNIMFTGHEVLGLLQPIHGFHRLFLSDTHLLLIESAMFTLGSFFYLIGYLTIFPNVKKTILCQE